MKAAGVMIRDAGSYVLFVRRAGDGDHVREWAFPGGGIEDGETPEVAARRECIEELGPDVPDGQITVFNRATSAEGVEFTTFVQHVGEQFEPTLNDEHDAFEWRPVNDPPTPLHPGVRDLLLTIAGPPLAQDTLALDRASVRTFDADGHLHVSSSNISIAAVNEYLGSEIPEWESLGLDANKLYRLLRAPDELEAAAASFDGKPLLMRHKPTTADEHATDLVVGAISNPVFGLPFLKAELTVWTADAIKAIESGEQKELSSGYRYRADMTPGSYGGEPYDGVMRDIMGNHVALVKSGRAGPSVVVGDEALSPSNTPKGEIVMAKTKGSRVAAITQGALAVYLLPKIAQDQKIELGPIVSGLTAKNFAAKKDGIATAVKAAANGKLAVDAKLDDLPKVLDLIALDADDDKDDVAEDEDDEDKDGKKKEAEDEESDDDKKKAAEDEEKDEEKSKQAMDAAIAKRVGPAVQAAVAAERKRADGVRAAEKAVRPYVGELAIACDSAEQVYRTAFKMMDVKVGDDVHASALPHILAAQPKPGARKDSTPRIAQDAAAVKSFAARFPGATRIGIAN